MCGGHGVFPAWSSLRTSWTRLVRVSIPDGLLLLSWRTPLADCSRGLHYWSSHSVPECFEIVLHLCWTFWGPAKGLHIRFCQTPSWSQWNCEVLHDDSTVEGLFYCASLWSKTCLFFSQQFLRHYKCDKCQTLHRCTMSLCRTVLLIEVYLFIFQGHRIVEQHWLKILCFYLIQLKLVGLLSKWSRQWI